MPGTKNSGNRSGKPRAPGAGRTPKAFTIEQDRPIHINYIGDDESFSQLADGAAQIVKKNGTRMIVVKIAGGEIRVVL